MNELQRVTREFGGYNPKRYSKPWIARVVEWPIGGRPVLVFGEYIGDADGGECEIMAAIGDVVKYGKKDNRNINGTLNEFGIVREDLSIERVTMGTARKQFITNKKEE